MVDAAHPRSVIELTDGRGVQLKVHQCVWSGDYRGNTLPAIQECYRARVARAEIDVAMLRDRDFLVIHDLDLVSSSNHTGRVSDLAAHAAADVRLTRGGRPPLLSEVV